MKHNHLQPSQGFYLRNTKKDIFLGEDLEEAKAVFRTNFYDYLNDSKYWIEYRYAPWLTAYCNSKQNSEEGWTGIDRSSDFLRYNTPEDIKHFIGTISTTNLIAKSKEKS